MRTRVVFAFLLTAAALLIGFQPAAEAAGSGTAVVQCTAWFPWVPWTNTANPNTGGTCNGTAAIAAAGLDDSLVPFTVEGTGVFAAAFAYYEICSANGQPIILSFADGTFAVNGLPATHGTASTTASVTGSFSWDRIGLNPAITISNLVVSFADGGTSSTPGVGAGTATFVPLGLDITRHGACGQAGGPLAIDVVIAADVLV